MVTQSSYIDGNRKGCAERDGGRVSSEHLRSETTHRGQSDKMQTLRDQDALIPRPRGELPKLCAAGLVALATMGVVVLSPDSFLGMVALAALMVTLGPLLHGLCLLAEELRHHSNTRYRACRHMLPACGLWGKTLLAAGLAGLFLYLTKQLLPPRDQCWELLVLVPAVYALLKSLGVMGPSEVEVSGICEGRKMNVAHGLAWSFYLGYLQLVLPRLENSIAAFCAAHHRSTPLWSRGSRKLLILVPLSANISHKLEDEDDNISFLENLPNNEIDRAGVRGRVYKHSVYRVKDGQGAAHDCAVEYATPLLTLYRMSQERSAGFGEPERRQQVLLFYRTLQDVLEQSLECRNRYKLILLSDEHEDDPHFLSKAILRHLDRDISGWPCCKHLQRLQLRSSSRRSPNKPRPRKTTAPTKHAPDQTRPHVPVELPGAPLVVRIIRHKVKRYYWDQQEREEFCLHPVPEQETKETFVGLGLAPSAGGNQPQPEPMSREPTLMISLEKPQSLQVPVENTDIHHRGT
ncbi:stimulator of interferon genes protein isoform X2 [Nothobranchius furzeri]|uniref:stimulator of interferon genes protein isoform X2 n=1 Tax=Nothobranchius furzeri TaxID=105023 RepID=UPI0039046F0C